ncbi:hypothetical protein EVAR_23829_1 [Eumeta japonica]|uniref:Uncharacterized protein n=1 Tax=Eumeta variegata TaxID=151549 RepID=A0A4C1VK47_EUMVA|nr:hypothetical protein EVAR_23829_1 [Eumeta japonica]
MGIGGYMKINVGGGMRGGDAASSRIPGCSAAEYPVDSPITPTSLPYLAGMGGGVLLRKLHVQCIRSSAATNGPRNDVPRIGLRAPRSARALTDGPRGARGEFTCLPFLWETNGEYFVVNNVLLLAF